MKTSNTLYNKPPASRECARSIVVRVAAFTLLLLGLAFAPPAFAQSSSGAPLRLDVSVRAQLTDATSMTVGGLYLNDLNISVPLVLIDHRLDKHWGLHGGYLFATRDVENGPDRTTQFIRLGLAYRQTNEAFTFDNRLAHEIVIDDQRDDIGGRVRNRMRLTHTSTFAGEQALRMFGYLEPIMEYGLGRSSRIDLAIGAGVTLSQGPTVDAYVLSQHYLQRPDSSVDALVLQVQLQR